MVNLDGNLPSYEQQQRALELLQEIGVDTDALITQLGTPTSAASSATSGNAHAKLNWLLATLATVNTNTTTSNLGAPAAAASNTTSAVAHAKLNWLLANVSTGIVKSVQRGTVSSDIVGSSSGAEITVSYANPQKVDIDLYGNAAYNNGGGDPYVISFDGTKLKIKSYAFNSNALVSWQIVEYY